MGWGLVICRLPVTFLTAVHRSKELVLESRCARFLQFSLVISLPILAAVESASSCFPRCMRLFFLLKRDFISGVKQSESEDVIVTVLVGKN